MVDNMTFLIQTKGFNGYLEERLAEEITASFQRLSIPERVRRNSRL